MHSSIFSGQVSHARKTPKAHAFSYGVYMMYLDLSELDEVFKGRWFWSTSRPALARFRREQHFGDPTVSLDETVRQLVESETGHRPDGPIRLLTNIAWFGYCFNPICLYYCFNKEDTRVTTVVAEVSNTPWGERHCYVLADSMNKGNEDTRRFTTAKEMHVSPFIDMNVEYDWLLTPPGDGLVVRINDRSGEDRFFTATMIMKRREISTASLAFVLFRYPFMTLRVMFGIHWQALRLWLKGCPIVAHPDKNESIQVNS